MVRVDVGQKKGYDMAASVPEELAAFDKIATGDVG